MMTKIGLFIICLGVFLYVTGNMLFAQTVPVNSPATAYPDAYTRIADSSSKVATIKSDFIQEKHLAMMEKVIISKGVFYFEKPDRLRWELVAPSVFGFSVNGDKAKRWRGKKRRSQSFKISREPILKVIIEQVFAWANADFERLEKGYEITVQSKDPISLKLLPQNTQEKKFLNHLILTFSKDCSYVDSVEVHEKGNDFTRIRFVNAILNQPHQPDLF